MAAGTAVAVVLAVLAGLAGPVQAAVMGKLGERIGVIEALAFAALISASLAVTGLLLIRQSLAGISSGARAPVWLWLGGVMSALIVLAVTVAAPRIGTTATIGIIIAGNLAAAAVIDRYGLFGLDQIPLTAGRVLGIALLALGAALTLQRP